MEESIDTQGRFLVMHRGIDMQIESREARPLLYIFDGHTVLALHGVLSIVKPKSL